MDPPHGLIDTAQAAALVITKQELWAMKQRAKKPNKYKLAKEAILGVYYDSMGTFEVLRTRKALSHQGFNYSHVIVRRLMSNMGLKPVMDIIKQ